MVSVERNLRLVRNEKEYFEFIRTLRNDPVIKSGFINQEEISIEQHQIYMDEHQDSYFICLMGDKPVGYIGVVDDDIRIAVSSNYHSRGIGKFMVLEILKLFPHACAKVKIENIPSQQLFEGLGFTKEFTTYKNPFMP